MHLNLSKEFLFFDPVKVTIDLTVLLFSGLGEKPVVNPLEKVNEDCLACRIKLLYNKATIFSGSC